jgi:hypothetical protein
MTPGEAEKYSEGNNKGVTQCNNYLGDKIKATYGKEMYDKLFPNGMESANNLARQFASNPNLEAIDTSKYSIKQIQAMADKGALIIMSYKNPDPNVSGHVAFVANSGVGMFSVPTVYVGEDGEKRYPAQTGYGYNQPSDDGWPILSQAGTITGNVTMGWGTEKWNSSEKPTYNNITYNSYKDFLLDNYISYYMIKRGYK